MAELECQLESAHRESQDRVAEVTEVRAVEQATTAERGLEVMKVRQEETEVALQKSLHEDRGSTPKYPRDGAEGRGVRAEGPIGGRPGSARALGPGAWD